MIKRTLVAVIFLILFDGAYAQYYYKDIIGNTQLVADVKNYKENKVKKITLKSFEDNGVASEGFFCEKKFNKDYTKAELFTRADLAEASLLISYFDKEGKLIRTYDSSTNAVTEIKYSYQGNNIRNIFSIVRSKDVDFNNSITEEHIYNYENNIPVKMTRIKNGTDSAFILFLKDDNGNIAIEKDTKNGTKFYYYYDTKNRITDIVQENEYSNNLRPDYVFEYNNAGLLTQMTAVEEGSKNYFIWKYSYDNGLRTKERCFTNEKRLMGSIEYEYK